MAADEGIIKAVDALTVIEQFNDALNRHDVDGMMALLTEDCAFENTSPAPGGTRYEGQAAVRAFWDDFFRQSPNARIDPEELFAVGDRCIMRWTYTWIDPEGQPGFVRGVDIYRMRDGKIAEKLSYVKG